MLARSQICGVVGGLVLAVLLESAELSDNLWQQTMANVGTIGYYGSDEL
jgi:hypothetical protein